MLTPVFTVTMAGAAEPTPAFAGLNARQAVREGNRRLLEAKPGEALGAYRYAEELKPDLREIAFIQGLAHYDMTEFEEAREAFRRAADAESDRLADDALYSLGTCDHAEALANLDNPKHALSLLENAMRRYHDVLTKHPDHALARDANFKAASIWRELRQQQQQQQNQECDQDGEEGDEENQDQQQQRQDENEQEQDNQQSRSEQNDEQREQQDQSESADQQEDQQQQQQQQASEVDQQERVSREQAERRLREMMQSQRERKKMRREPVQRMPVKPVDRDW